MHLYVSEFVLHYDCFEAESGIKSYKNYRKGLLDKDAPMKRGFFSSCHSFPKLFGPLTGIVGT